MQDKCPKCGEPLITRTIKKELGLGSIDYPIAQVCPKCNWSRDLTGAGDIVSKPVTVAPGDIKKEEKTPIVTAAPPKAAPIKVPAKPAPSSDFNKLITVALAILVLGGLVWAFFLYPPSQKQVPEITPTPTTTPEVTRTTVQPTSTPLTEVTPTGKSIPVFLDRQRGFIRNKDITIKPGDEIIWRNTGIDTITLVSSDGIFDAQLLANDKEFHYILNKTGTYNFYLQGKDLKGTITVEP